MASKNNKQGIEKYRAISFATTLFVTGIVLGKIFPEKFETFLRFESFENYMDLLGILFTVVFLTTTLMSTLGDKKEIIFYRNIIEQELIMPKGRNFKDLSIYAFLSLGFATIAGIINNEVMFLLSYTFGISDIVWIFFKMINIHYDKDKTRNYLMKEMQNCGDALFYENLQKFRVVLNGYVQENDQDNLKYDIAFLLNLLWFYDYKSEEKARYEAVEAIFIRLKVRVEAFLFVDIILDSISTILGMNCESKPLFPIEDNFEKNQRDDYIIRLFCGTLSEIAAEKRTCPEIEEVRHVQNRMIKSILEQRETRLLKELEMFLESEEYSWGKMGYNKLNKLTRYDSLECDYDGTYETAIKHTFIISSELGKEVFVHRVVETYPDTELIDINEDIYTGNDIYSFPEVIKKCIELDEKEARTSLKELNEEEMGYRYDYMTSFDSFIRCIPSLVHQQEGERTLALLEHFFEAFCEHCFPHITGKGDEEEKVIDKGVNYLMTLLEKEGTDNKNIYEQEQFVAECKFWCRENYRLYGDEKKADLYNFEFTEFLSGCIDLLDDDVTDVEVGIAKKISEWIYQYFKLISFSYSDEKCVEYDMFRMILSKVNAEMKGKVLVDSIRNLIVRQVEKKEEIEVGHISYSVKFLNCNVQSILHRTD